MESQKLPFALHLLKKYRTLGQYMGNQAKEALYNYLFELNNNRSMQMPQVSHSNSTDFSEKKLSKIFYIV